MENRRSSGKIHSHRDPAAARRIIIAFPKELIRNYCQASFVDRSMIIDFAVHDDNEGNPHAHVFIGHVLHELIEAICMGASDKSSGPGVQSIHIKYNGIGFIPINEPMAKQTA